MMLLSKAALFSLLLSSAKANFRDADKPGEIFSTYHPGGVQSGPDEWGSTFASSVVYSKADNTVLLTGTTWGRYFESREQINDEEFDAYTGKAVTPNIKSGCFLAVASLPGVDSRGARSTEVEWRRKQRLRSPSANQACSTVCLHPSSKDVFVAAHAEEVKNVTVAPEVIKEEVKLQGMLLDLDWNQGGDYSFKSQGGQILKDNGLVYPMAITSQKGDEGMYVVFQQSQRPTPNHINQKEGEQERDPAKYFEYGTGYGFAVARYDLVAQHPTPKTTTKRIQQIWNVPFETDYGQGKVLVNDILLVTNGLLVVVGSTTGKGPAYGKVDSGKDWDGFITKINPATGQKILSPGYDSSKRIQSAKNRDDFITGVCHHPSEPHLYVSGTTEGALPGQKAAGTSAFLMKVDLLTLQTVWTKQFSSNKGRRKGHAHAMACDVSPQGSHVWVGGIVEEGGVMYGADASAGGMDVFVAKVSTDNGDVEFVKQVGSEKNDELAARGGLVCDSEGNAVIVGNTYGSFFRQRSPKETIADVFVMTVSQFEGQMVATVSSSSNSGFGVGLFVLFMLVAAALLAGAAFFVSKRSSKNDEQVDRHEVTRYLATYNVEDVDLKHSATGGWHCSYSGNLAEGKVVERAESSEHDEMGASGRSLLKRPSGSFGGLLHRRSNSKKVDGDGLFLLDAAPVAQTSFGEEDDPRSAYGDLVAKYNDAWDESRMSEFSDRSGRSRKSDTWGKDIV
jgi:hypothetical protein